MATSKATGFERGDKPETIGVSAELFASLWAAATYSRELATELEARTGGQVAAAYRERAARLGEVEAAADECAFGHGKYWIGSGASAELARLAGRSVAHPTSDNASYVVFGLRFS